MDRSPTSPGIVLAIAALSLVAILPMLVYPMGGDILLHEVLIQCFNNQFWQGDLYPRWCMTANTGLGAPFFYIYFPLPYFVTALLDPLRGWGLSLYHLIAISYYLASLITCIGAYTWLKAYAKSNYAFLATAMFLLLPYHGEILFNRVAYAEVWFYAFLPWLFHYLRQLAYTRRPAIAPLALVIGLSLLSHVPCTLIALLFGGLYLLLTQGLNKILLKKYLQAIGIACLLTSFYLAPALLLRPFFNLSQIVDPTQNWPNLFVSLDLIKRQGLWQQAAMIGFGCIIWLLLLIRVISRRYKIHSSDARREAISWCIMSVLAFILLFPISKPLYFLTGPLAEYLFPWRMQLIITMAIAVLSAQWMQHLVAQKRQKNIPADMTLVLLLLMLCGYFQLSIYDERNAQLFDDSLKAEYNIGPQYRTIWLDDEHYNNKYIVDRFHAPETIEQISPIEGRGEFKLESWKNNSITLEIKSSETMVLRLDHLYFPSWQAHDKNGNDILLEPESGSGLMTIEVPAGEHRITLTESTKNIQPILVYLSYCVTWLTAFALTYFLLKRFTEHPARVSQKKRFRL